MEPKNLAKDCIEGLLYPCYVHYEEYLGAAEYLAGKMNLIKVFSPFTDEVVESCVEKHDKYDLTLFTILYEDFIEYLSYKIGSVFCVADELNLDILQAQRKIFNNTIIIQSKIGDIPMLANLKKMMSKLEWHSFCKWYEYSLWAAILRWPIYFLLGYYEYADQRFCKSDDFFKKEVLTQRIEKQIQIYYQSFNLL